MQVNAFSPFKINSAPFISILLSVAALLATVRLVY